MTSSHLGNDLGGEDARSKSTTENLLELLVETTNAKLLKLELGVNDRGLLDHLLRANDLDGGVSRLDEHACGALVEDTIRRLA